MGFIQQALLSVVAEKNHWKSDLVVATDQIHATDLKELSDWFSERLPDSTFRFEATNLFFHPLPSGNMTLGRMIPKTGQVFSHLKKERSFYVHYLIVSPQSLLKFANNPIALYQHLLAENGQPFLRKPSQRLKPIRLLEPASPVPLVDKRILGELNENPGPKATAVLLQTALDSVCTFFTGGPTAIQTLYGLFNLLPLSWRTELTFSTDLHFSRSRPFKLVGIPSKANKFHVQSNDHGISFCDLDTLRNTECKNTFLEAWPLLIFHLLQRQEFGLLQKIYREESRSVPGLPTADCPPGSNPEELRILGNRCLRTLLTPPTDHEQIIRTWSVLRRPDSGESIDLAPFVFPDLEKTEFAVPQPSWLDSTFAETDRPGFDEEPPVPLLDPLVPTPLATMIQQKVVKINDTDSSLLKRIKKYPYLKDELRWLDSCTARVLLGDSSAQVPFRKCWSNIRRQTDTVERLELTEDYLLLIRDFMTSSSLRDEPRLLERDINILELLDVLLE